MAKLHWANVEMSDEDLAKIQRYVNNRIFGGLKNFSKRDTLNFLLTGECYHILSTLVEEQESRR